MEKKTIDKNLLENRCTKYNAKSEICYYTKEEEIMYINCYYLEGNKCSFDIPIQVNKSPIIQYKYVLDKKNE